MNKTHDAVNALQSRAGHLRREASTMHPLVAGAYRRRAAELELGAWALAIRCGVPPADCRRAPAAA